MEINSTIIVQLINFIIAYIVLRQFLFKPIMAVVQQENFERDSLISLVEARTVIVQQKELEKKERWAAHQRSLSLLMPQTRAELMVFKDIEPWLMVEPISEQTVDQSAKSIAGVMVRKVEHGSL